MTEKRSPLTDSKFQRKRKARLEARVNSYNEDKRTNTKIANMLRKPGSQNRKK